MGIMGEMWRIYQDRRFGRHKFDYYTHQHCIYRSKLEEHLKSCCDKHGINGLFYGLENECHEDLFYLMRSYKIKDARKKWNRFVKNNLLMSPSFVKEGDTIHMDETFFNRPIDGVVVGITDTKILIVKDQIGSNIYISPFKDFTVNGEKREPKFLIKRYRKIYGLDKE